MSDEKQLSALLGWDSDQVVNNQKNRPWIVQDFIAADSVAWIYGAPGSFKSFAAIDLAMSVATGTPWHGREVSKGVVLFIAAEGGDDIHVRRAAWAKYNKADGLLKITDAQPEIDSTEEHDYTGGEVLYRSGFGQLRQVLSDIRELKSGFQRQLKEALNLLPRAKAALEYAQKEVDEYSDRSVSAPDFLNERLQEAAQKHGETEGEVERLKSLLKALENDQMADAIKPKLIVIDTFAATASDDTKDAVNRYTRNLYRALKTIVPGAAFLVIDHTTKQGDTWMGSQAKLGNVDMMCAAESKGDLLNLTMNGGKGKIKSCQAFDPIHLQLKPVELDSVDAYGRKISTLVCTDGAKAKKLSDLAEGDGDGGAILALIEKAGDPIARSELRDQFAELPANQKKKPDTVQRNFRRTLKQLLTDEVITESDNQITLNQ